MHVARPLADPVHVLACSACGQEVPVPPAHLLHLPDGRHHVVTAPALDQEALRQARVGLLAIAVRLDDLRDDLERVRTTLDQVDQ